MSQLPTEIEVQEFEDQEFLRTRQTNRRRSCALRAAVRQALAWAAWCREYDRSGSTEGYEATEVSAGG